MMRAIQTGRHGPSAGRREAGNGQASSLLERVASVGYRIGPSHRRMYSKEVRRRTRRPPLTPQPARRRPPPWRQRRERLVRPSCCRERPRAWVLTISSFWMLPVPFVELEYRVFHFHRAGLFPARNSNEERRKLVKRTTHRGRLGCAILFWAKRLTCAWILCVLSSAALAVDYNVLRSPRPR